MSAPEPVRRRPLILQQVNQIAAELGKDPVLEEELELMTFGGVWGRARPHFLKNVTRWLDQRDLAVALPDPEPPYVPPPPVQGTVYFAEALGCERIKIGFTAGDADKRIRELQTGCPFPIRLIGEREGTISDEFALHARFAAARIMKNAEWFHATPELRGEALR